MRIDRIWLAVAGLSGAVAVGFGAYAAHAASTPEAVARIDIAARYQMYHALALLAVACLSRPGARFVVLAGLLFTVGSVLFCGTLYWIALRDLPSIPAVPIGGTAFILGWLSLAVSAVLDRASPPR